MQFRKYTPGTFMYFMMGVLTLQAQNTTPKNTIKTILPASRYEALSKLNDNPKAKKYNGRQLKELSNSDLFFQMSEDIASGPTNVNYGELPIEVLKERLEKLNEKSLFSIEYSPVLKQVIKSFLKNRRSSLERLMSLSDYYFPMFEQEMSNQRIPLEIKYLTMIEPALNPKARSHVGVTGLWQSVYATDKSYGLEVNNYVDEHSNPIRATKAAAKYLNELYKIFGDWDLVFTTYNSGPGNVTEVTCRSGGKASYWNLCPYLPKEIVGYMSAFLATLYIFEYAEEHGLKPQKRANHLFKADTIRVKQAVPPEDIAETTGMDVQDIQFFNPSYQLDMALYVERCNYTVRLPTSEIGRLVANEEATYSCPDEEKAKHEKPLPEVMKGDQYLAKAGNKIAYTAKKGDNLGKIASRNGTSISNFKRRNRIKGKNVRVEQRLIIYK